MESARRASTGLAGSPGSARRDVVGGVDQLRPARTSRDRRVGLPLRRRRRRDPPPPERAHAERLARGDPGRRARDPLRLPRRRPLGPGAGSALQPRQAAARPLRPSGLRRPGARPGDLRLRARQPPDPQHVGLRAVRAARCGHCPRRLRLGRRGAHQAALARHRHLRAARQGHDRPARPGPRAPARDLRRAGQPRGRRLPVRPRRERRRAAARAAVGDRDLRARAGADQLLGLQHHRLLRPPPRLRRHRGPRPAGHRVQGDGQGLPRRTDRGLPRRRLQPHRRGGPARSDALLPRPRRPGLLLAGDARQAAGGGRRRLDGRRLLGRHRLRQHRRCRRPVRAAPDPRLAAPLGHRVPRRRVPLRPAVGADPRQPRRRHALPPAADRHRPGPRAAAGRS